MKKIVILCIVPFVFVLVACEDSSSPDSLVKKRIFQHVDTDRMGTLKDLEIVSVKKINDTTYEAVHTFTNPIVEIEMQVKRNYFFTTNTALRFPLASFALNLATLVSTNIRNQINIVCTSVF